MLCIHLWSFHLKPSLFSNVRILSCESLSALLSIPFRFHWVLHVFYFETSSLTQVLFRSIFFNFQLFRDFAMILNVKDFWLDSVWSGKYSVWLQFLSVSWGLFYDVRHGLFWWMFRGGLKKMHVLLLDGVFSGYGICVLRLLYWGACLGRHLPPGPWWKYDLAGVECVLPKRFSDIRPLFLSLLSLLGWKLLQHGVCDVCGRQ